MQDSGKKAKPETVKVLMLGESGIYFLDPLISLITS